MIKQISPKFYFFLFVFFTTLNQQDFYTLWSIFMSQQSSSHQPVHTGLVLSTPPSCGIHSRGSVAAPSRPITSHHVASVPACSSSQSNENLPPMGQSGVQWITQPDGGRHVRGRFPPQIKWTLTGFQVGFFSFFFLSLSLPLLPRVKHVSAGPLCCTLRTFCLKIQSGRSQCTSAGKKNKTKLSWS